MSSAPEPFTHAIASRDGLFFASRTGFALVAKCPFFGMTIRGDDIYCFGAGDQPWATTLEPSISSRSRSQPMIHATISPRVA